jgi:ribosomal protein S7
MNIFQKILLLLGFVVFPSLAFITGYSLGKENATLSVIEKLQQKIDLTPIQTASNQMENASSRFNVASIQVDGVVKQLETEIAQLKKVSNEIVTALASSEKDTTQPVATINEATSPLTEEVHNTEDTAIAELTEQTDEESLSTEEVPDTKDTVIAELTEQTDNETSAQINRMFYVIDHKKVDNMTQSALSGDTTDVEQAIQTLARIGTPIIQNQINNIILDKKEDMGLRLTAIEAVDWKDNANGLSIIYQTDSNHEIRLATVLAARETEFNKNDKQQINQTLFDNFTKENNESVKLEILDYFADEQPEKVQQLLDLVSPEDFSPEVGKQVELLRTGLSNSENEE